MADVRDELLELIATYEVLQDELKKLQDEIAEEQRKLDEKLAPKNVKLQQLAQKKKEILEKIADLTEKLGGHAELLKEADIIIRTEIRKNYARTPVYKKILDYMFTQIPLIRRALKHVTNMLLKAKDLFYKWSRDEYLIIEKVSEKEKLVEEKVRTLEKHTPEVSKETEEFWRKLRRSSIVEFRQSLRKVAADLGIDISDSDVVETDATIQYLIDRWENTYTQLDEVLMSVDHTLENAEDALKDLHFTLTSQDLFSEVAQ